MLIYNNNSDTVIVVLHEIYGLNGHITSMCKQLSEYKVDVIAPNLLNSQEPFGYEQEETAYRFFIANIGFASAADQVKEMLSQARRQYQKVYVLGYSIGATLAWLCSETGLCDLIAGFYGSRIRDYLLVKPNCPCLLFFPAAEQSFDVDTLIYDVSRIEKVYSKKLEGAHGFADPFSKKYNKKSSMKACVDIKSFIISNETTYMAASTPNLCQRRRAHYGKK